jgi:SAM-dependent methyltransferase
MTMQEKFYPETLFGGYTDIDGTVAFFSRVNTLLDPSFVVLDVGCGRGEYDEDPVSVRKDLRILKGKVAKVIGIDVDEGAKDNPFLDEFHLISDGPWPVESNSVDLIVCDNVMEHVENPDQLVAEFCRVLKNDGYLCLRTPNRWNYISLVATLVPNKYHSKVTSFAQEGRKEEDVFPTFYRCNSSRKLKNNMKKNGFDSVVYTFEAEPSYLSFSWIAYALGVLHQKLAPGCARATIFAYGKIKK